jgi:hypothetical protein
MCTQNLKRRQSAENGCDILCRYILEGKELEFYLKKIQKKKSKGAAA